MRVLIQRVNRASVRIAEQNEERGIERGLLVLFGASARDEKTDAVSLRKQIDKLAKKTAMLRIFADEQGKMNRSAAELSLSVLVVSQFTLFADTKKGNRPSFSGAADPDFANQAYRSYLRSLSDFPLREIKTGEFGAEMRIALENDGPVTILLDTEDWESGEE